MHMTTKALKTDPDQGTKLLPFGMMLATGGSMIVSLIARVLDSLLSTFNQLIPKGRDKVRQTPLHREHPWENQKKIPPILHGKIKENHCPLGAIHSETKIYNHPRR